MTDNEKKFEETYEKLVENYRKLNRHLETELFRQRELIKEQEQDSFYTILIFIYLYASLYCLCRFQGLFRKTKKANRTVKRDSRFNYSNPSEYCPCIGLDRRK